MIRSPSPMPAVLNYGRPVNRECSLNRGLVSWWLGMPQGGHGNTWFDIAGTNHGTLTNGAFWRSARSRPSGNMSMQFDGTNDRVDCPHSGSLNITTNTLTLCAWVNPANIITWHNICGKPAADGSHADPYYAYALVIENAVGGKLRCFITTGGTATWHDTTAILAANAWSHVCMVYDGALIRGFINGQASGTTAKTGNINSYSTSFRIGSSGDGGEFLTGAADDIRLWNRALLEDEVRAVYFDSRAGYPRTLNRIRMPFGNSVAAPAGLSIPVAMHNYRRRRVA